MKFLALKVHYVLVLLLDNAIEAFLDFWLDHYVSRSKGLVRENILVWEDILFFVLSFQREFH
jgi:hypothetical protein